MAGDVPVAARNVWRKWKPRRRIAWFATYWPVGIEGKVCASCGQPIGEIDLAGAKPALLRTDRVSVEWSQVPAEQLQETLATSSPICFACHTANRLVHEHPELVLDRGRHPLYS